MTTFSSSGSASTVELRSPEGVRLDLRVASPAARIAAYAIDSILVTSLLLLAIWTMAWGSILWEPFADGLEQYQQHIDRRDPDGAQEALRGALAPALVVLTLVMYFGELLYFTAFELLLSGRTPGKLVLKLRVVGEGGTPLTVRAVALRNLMRLADMLPSSYVVGLVSMVVSSNSRRLGDLVAGTLVLRTDQPPRPPDIALSPEVPPLALSRAQLARLGPRELQLARNTLRRLQDTRLHRAEEDVNQKNRELLEQVSAALCRALELDPTEHQNRRRLIERVLKTAETQSR